jgi:pilus assembly protein CpaB
MKLKTWIPLILAVVFGLVAMKVAKDMMARKSGPSEVRVSLSQVVVTRHNVPAGAMLHADDLTTAKVGGDFAAEAVFRDPAELEGRVVTTGLVKGQPVMETLLAPKGTGSGLQAVVPRGMRAITLEINEFSGVAGFLVPGCRVDVVSTINADGGDVVSRTVVQNVEVTALGRRTQPGDDTDPSKSVTLLVKPREAEAIELAAATGRPRLVLRSSGDRDVSRSEGITVAELRGGAKRVDPFAGSLTELLRPTMTTPATRPATPEPATPVAFQPAVREHTVKVIRGGVESEVTMTLPPDNGVRRMTDAK